MARLGFLSFFDERRTLKFSHLGSSVSLNVCSLQLYGGNDDDEV